MDCLALASASGALAVAVSVASVMLFVELVRLGRGDAVEAGGFAGTVPALVVVCFAALGFAALMLCSTFAAAGATEATAFVEPLPAEMVIGPAERGGPCGADVTDDRVLREAAQAWSARVSALLAYSLVRASPSSERKRTGRGRSWVRDTEDGVPS